MTEDERTEVERIAALKEAGLVIDDHVVLANKEIDQIEQELADHSIAKTELVDGLRDRPDRWHEEPAQGPERQNLENDIDALKSSVKAANVHGEGPSVEEMERRLEADSGLSRVVVEPSDDPFDLVNAPGQNLIVLMRLYDVLMGLYSNVEPQKAAALLEIHNSGKLLLDYPSLVVDE